MENEIKLTLNPGNGSGNVPSAVTAGNTSDYVKNLEDAAKLSDAENSQIAEFAKQIDIADTATVVQYGAQSQKKIADFSDTALEKVKAKDIGEVGEMLSDLIARLKESPSETKGFLGMFKKLLPIDKIRAKYSTVEKDVDKVSDILADHRNTLIRDITLFDELYDTNLNCFKEITMYILAGKKAIEDAKAGKLAELQAKAKETGLAEDAQSASDYSDLITRFEKKLYDLELTRTVNMQMAPQIRMIQNNDIAMSDKIQTVLTNTIPLWKNQMVIALGIADTQAALKAERTVSEMTNDLLKKNAEALKQGTTEIARENERGIIDIETLNETNQKLIDTLTEVTGIQEEGRTKRAEAEKDLAKIETELKSKLLELSRASSAKG